MALLIHDALCVATQDDQRRRLANASILIEGEAIQAVGPAEEIAALAPAGARRIDASRHVVLPGFVNTHHHFGQILTRAYPGLQTATLFEWLVGLYPVWVNWTPDDLYWAAMAALGELLLTGCTMSTDHHYLFPRAIGNGFIEAEIRAARALGARFHPTRGAMSLGQSNGGLPPDACCQDDAAILKDAEHLIDQFHDPSRFSMLRIAIAPCAPFNVTESLMQETIRLARDRGVRVHTHLAETVDETVYCRERYGVRPVELMERWGWLGPDVWFAHCVQLNEDEIRLFAERGVSVAHCPSSNCRLGSGIAPAPALTRAGVAVGMAVDGSSSNDSSSMLEELRRALLVHRAVGGPAATDVDMVLGWATRGGARVLGREDTGVIAPGYAADLALFRVDTLDYAGGSVHDPLAALLMCGNSSRADWTIVNGVVVVEKGRLAFADEQEITGRVNAAARRLALNAAAAR